MIVSAEIKLSAENAIVSVCYSLTKNNKHFSKLFVEYVSTNWAICIKV